VRLLVTGAAGFIGTNFVRHWLADHPEDSVVALDALTYAASESNLASVRDRVPFVRADIGDLATVEEALRVHRIETIVNFAAESHNSLAVLDPARFLRTNVLGTQALLEAARRVGIARFHHVSTCEVYGDLALDDPGAFTEESPYRPRTPYNASKAAADHIARAYHETYGLPVTISICSNNYGPYQFPEKVLPLFISHALDDQPLPIYTSADHRREWLHVSDHCAAIDLVLHRGTIGETYNIGSGEERTITQLADSVLALLDKPADLRRTVPDRPGHDRRYLLDSSRLRSLGWAPSVAFEQGIDQTVQWYVDHRFWWEPLRDRAPVTESGW
jgi:dTDP-glucose 4,6-dehydratase